MDPKIKGPVVVVEITHCVLFIYTAAVGRPVLSEDCEEGRILIRKEVMRLIINMSSSVGVKATEQSLLT